MISLNKSPQISQINTINHVILKSSYRLIQLSIIRWDTIKIQYCICTMYFKNVNLMKRMYYIINERSIHRGLPLFELCATHVLIRALNPQVNKLYLN